MRRISHSGWFYETVFLVGDRYNRDSFGRRCDTAVRDAKILFGPLEASAEQQRHQAPAGKVAVEVAVSRKATKIGAIGTLQSDETGRIAHEVAGRIDVTRFQEGQAVKAGDIMVS